ncbi:hypothetical protein TEA_018618 [Camellia sinensis var. sinensis]|uniref:Fatty acid hydroxylase domain-containing protein n=1 Tax=Camellia sinensis var. sinensis TaxID=542762 RepID=A0A4S4ENV1_CAMSN|nr:hypothetical protein TEA_018618 [Camellia sinensis var. sinensis]
MFPGNHGNTVFLLVAFSDCDAYGVTRRTKSWRIIHSINGGCYQEVEKFKPQKALETWRKLSEANSALEIQLNMLSTMAKKHWDSYKSTIDNYSMHRPEKVVSGRLNGYVSDEAMGTFAPIVVYWLYAGFYQLLPPLDNYRMHTRKEEEEKNLVPLCSVVKGVLLQQLVQATVAVALFLRLALTWVSPTIEAEVVTSWEDGNDNVEGEKSLKYGCNYVSLKVTSKVNSSGVTIQPSLPVQIVQIVVAMLVMDTWQYFVHRYMHQNKLLYRHVHSQHHRLVVPYAIGALYNHPLEGLLLDTFGGAISFLVSGMTARTAVIFFCFAVIKTVDDHCGLWLPGNIFHLFFQNNTAYHDIHHQLQGAKYNYSQPFFPVWDKLLGTHMPYKLVKRPEGGFEARPVKD